MAAAGLPGKPSITQRGMDVWVRFVLLQEPCVSCAICLDDRTMWKKGVAGIQVVTNAMRAGAQADAILRMERQPDNLNNFITK